MVLDGPTFMATEGWDWIPAIRDRNTGIWQDVVLSASGLVQIGDPQVVTTLPLPDTSRADVEIEVPLNNLSNAPVQGSVTASFDEITVTKNVTLPPGESTVKLAPAEFAQLTVQHPRLWWPNGYGKPELYRLKLAFSSAAGSSDTKELNFGIREITYELSLYDSAGHLRRVEISPTTARARDEQIVDVSHEGMRQIPHGWVASLAPGGESSPAVKPVDAMENPTPPGAKSGPAHRPRHQSQRRQNRLPRRQLGNGRLAQARLARTPRTLFPSASRRQPEHHSQLGGPEHGRSLLRSRRRIRSADLERLLGDDAGLQPRTGGSRAVPEKRARHDSALSQSSFDRRLVRSQRRRSSAHHQ